MPLREYTFLGTTESLCPECRRVVPAKIINREGRVYFRKRCPEHGEREDFVCSDVSQYDRMEYAVPARLPAKFGVEPKRGCPYDCGLCTDHEQHTCVGLVEITDACNLTCPMCYAASAPGKNHRSFEDCKRAIDRLVEVEGRPEILQLSGGEPTIHPEFERIFDYAISQPIDYVMINTNGIRLAHDPAFVERLAQHRSRVEIYLQFDGFRQETFKKLRGEALLEVKLKAVEQLTKFDLNATLVATLQAGVNDDELGALVEFGLEHRNITGCSFQPATYSGRHVLPEELERRMTFPDVIRKVAEQTRGLFKQDDFLPLPCAHPNCHSLAYAYRANGLIVPLTRFIDARNNLDLLANGISFTRSNARGLLESYLGKLGCCGGACGPESSSCAPATPNGLTVLSSAPNANPFAGVDFSKILGSIDLSGLRIPPNLDVASLASEFFSGALAEKIGAKDLFRITITSFLDPYNFDIRRLMKCCTHMVLPTGQLVPFCAYNTLYRDGFLPLPEITKREILDLVTIK